MAEIRIPPAMLPSDGRFGSGPSKVRPEALAGLAATGRSYLGTSHRQPNVRAVVGRIRTGLAELFSLPDGYEVVLGLGGSTIFWEVAAFSLIERRSQHAVLGEFSAKFAAVTAGAPFLDTPSLRPAEAGFAPVLEGEAGIDAYCLPHNETSTGVMLPVQRVAGADEGALLLVDATSGAGGLRVDVGQADAYYFAPQKGFGSDGGLWFALLSPEALDRLGSVRASGRWLPPTLDLTTAVENSRLDQTLNTPALTTLWLMADQVEWMLEHGGLPWCVGRTTASSSALYGWAERSPVATPFVADPAVRSLVVGTIDFLADVDASALAAVLRANGVLDTEPYRKLGRNQLRVGMFPAVDPADVQALTDCIDYVVEQLAA